ncbi:Uncharacterised protein [Nocardia africana]|uniref:Uncharacterized protein n=1 Tax=Nocardia africana TaxID=134964 RepID=A0A378WM29_9NOCA|nr:Uncharacterised protein [Nocardia africana]
MAPTKPISAPEVLRDQAACSSGLTGRLLDFASKTDGMILVTDPLPIPESTNRAMNPATRVTMVAPEATPPWWSAETLDTATTTAATIIPANPARVTRLPPNRSASLPP